MPRRLEFLDSVRGLAALSVLFSHYMAAYALPEWKETLWFRSPLHFAWDGLAAVSLFFVLSGFVLSVRLFDRQGNAVLTGFSLRGYAITRCFRIVGPYLVVVLLSFVAWKYAFGDFSTVPRTQDWIKYSWRDTLSPTLLVANFNLLAPGREYQIVPQAWTLSHELVLSLGIPIAVLVAGYSTRWFAFVVIFALTLLDTNRYALHFALGVGLAKAYAMGFRLHDRHVRIAALVVGGMLYSSRFSVFAHFPPPSTGTPIWYSTAIGSLLILWAVLSSSRLQELLRHPKLVFLGKISFQVYLCHFVVLIRATPLFLVLLNRYVSSNWGLCFAAGLLFSTASVVAVSWLLYEGVEKPFLRLGKKTAGYFSPERRGEPSPRNESETARRPRTDSEYPHRTLR